MNRDATLRIVNGVFFVVIGLVVVFVPIPHEPPWLHLLGGLIAVIGAALCVWWVLSRRGT